MKNCEISENISTLKALKSFYYQKEQNEGLKALEKLFEEEKGKTDKVLLKNKTLRKEKKLVKW